MSDDIEAVCERLWQRATVNITPVHSIKADRQPQGSYISGFRDDIDVWTNGDVRATQVEWQTFNLAADTDGTRRMLEIVKDGKLVFKATQEGRTTTTRFVGPEERYRGKQTTEAQPWRIVTGTAQDW